jgi:formamidase
MARRIGLAAVQMAPVAWDVEATLSKVEDTVSQVALSFPWAHLVVLPELVLSAVVQFAPGGRPEGWRQIAQPIPGPITDRLRRIAQETRRWLVPGSMYELSGDQVYNTALAVSPAGEIVARYRKLFPWLPWEAETTAGDQFCVFDIPEVGRFGLCICYDQWFPEVARSLVWLGAEAILQPTLTPTSDRSLELVLSQANAAFNQCYFVGVNGLGPFGGGRSLIVDPDGRVLQQAGDHETILTEVLDLDHVTRTRELGTFGLSQSLKQLRDRQHPFPIYQQGPANGPGFQKLGPLRVQHDLRLP